MRLEHRPWHRVGAYQLGMGRSADREQRQRAAGQCGQDDALQ
jgi:hypothetical protein